MSQAIVGIIMGSDSDLNIMKESILVLEEFGIPYDIAILSAHRTPELLMEYLKRSEANLKIIIAGAGAAAHLAGVIASHTSIPVIGVPIDSSSLLGVDSLYAIVQMPAGIPVATMAIGKAGAKNAGILAAQILSLQDASIKSKLNEFRKKQSQAIVVKGEKLNAMGWEAYLDRQENK